MPFIISQKANQNSEITAHTNNTEKKIDSPCELDKIN